MLSAFVSCLTEQLEKRGFGEKRHAELVDRFEGLREQFEKRGAADPETQAMARVLAEVERDTRDKQRLAYDTVLKRAELGQHFETYDYNAGIVRDKTATPAQAAIALLSPDPRAKSNLNVDTLSGTYKGQAWAVMNDILDTIGKGMFGMQRGKVHMDALVREIHGQATGDVFAAQMAKSWLKGTDAMVDMWNNVGGVLRKLDGWALPQRQSLASVIKNGSDTWIADHMNWLNWDKMSRPNGAPIKPEDRTRVLQAVYETLSTDGGNKIDPGSFNGNGAAIGNMMDQHRFLIFKDGDAWLAMHEKYGEGNVFDVMASYVDHMTQKMALMRVFGNNPEAMADTVKALALEKATEVGGGKLKRETSHALGTFDLLFEQAMRRNAMDPESVWANAIVGTSNILNSAFLSGSVLAAMPGDFATTMVMRAADHMPILDGLIGPYTRALVSPMEAASLSAEAGFIMDGLVHAIHSHTRFSGLAEFGPAWTRRISDLTMRLSGMNVHTEGLRWVNQQHWMGMLARDADNDFDAVSWKPVAERYGITADMWDKFKALETWKPRDGVEFLRPSDILSSGRAGGQDMYERFQSMILQESRNMVIDTSPEANVMLKGNLRPDTIPGALLHSFAMYKNFPIGLALTYGRAAMSMPEKTGRLAFVAGMGTSLVLAGAVGIQLREMSKGRDALPMDNLGFWGKSLLASGAMSVWGDFLFNGVNRMGGPADVVGGPIAGFVGDTTQLALGDVFDWADKVGSLKADKADHKTPWMAKAVEYASRYQPGTSLWYARAALQREIYDPLRMLADPKGASKMQHKERQRVKDFGNDAWWPPGQSLPNRPPQLTGGQ